MSDQTEPSAAGLVEECTKVAEKMEAYLEPVSAQDWDCVAAMQTLREAAAALSAPTREREHLPWGSPPEPVVNPSEEWCQQYADWYEGSSR